MDDLSTNQKTVGLNQTLKALEEGKIARVYLAEDAEDKIRTKVTLSCMKEDVEIISIESMKLLGKACGIDVKSAVCGILKD